LRKELRDHVATGRHQFRVVFGYGPVGLRAPQLKRDLAPGRPPQRRTVLPAPARKHVELGADKDRRARLGRLFDPGLGQDLLDARQTAGLRPALGQVVEQRECVGLAPAELGRHVVHRRGMPLKRRTTPEASSSRFFVRKVRRKNSSGLR